MKIKIGRLRSIAYSTVAVALTLAALIPALSGEAFAYGQVTSRSIEMNSSTVSATGVSYLTTFTPATATNIQGIVVDFCSNDPLIGDACTAPGGFTVGTPSVTVGSISGETGGSWTAASANSGRTLELTNGSATGTPSGAATFTLTTATNPNTTGSFYARIFTFASTAAVTTWAATANGSSTTGILDAGGIALSTANNVSITAKVMETLTFCASGTTLSANCSGATTPTLTIGHGIPAVITATAVDTQNAYTLVSTNAQTGATIRMKTNNTCSNGGLSTTTGGSTCNIPGIGGTTTAQTMTAGTAAFGMCVLPGSANTTATAPYNGASCGSGTTYGMDNTSGTAVTSNYGSPIFACAGPVSAETDTLTYAATAANTTQAGIYTATLNLIATGTF